MRSLYVTSIQTFSGKTALCLGLGRQMQSDGFRVGYFKPLSTQPRQVGAGQYGDEDALFAKQVLNLTELIKVLAPVCLTPPFVEEQLAGSTTDLTTVIVEAYNTAQQDKDVVVLKGGASLREECAVGLATATVTRMLGALVMSGEQLVATSDGLGVPAEMWQPGDVIVRRHLLKLPGDLVPGDYTLHVGLYITPYGPRLPLRASGDEHPLLATLHVTGK